MGKKGLQGSVPRLSKNRAKVTLHEPVEILTNLKVNLADADEKLRARDFYGKMIEGAGENGEGHVVRFTSVPSEIDAYFQSNRQNAAKPGV